MSLRLLKRRIKIRRSRLRSWGSRKTVWRLSCRPWGTGYRISRTGRSCLKNNTRRRFG
jgi:hypothetical protein